ncbi:MAG: hypothetical protein QG584_831 [Pseudomonadota bacterium]|jgi:hypothetical protein|nr:hypothetical protein [Pseudomonadota bacterium]MDQ5914940.1 hypothetical protein [Pseudomonadota bacterium]MDQ5944812.1 hypothetical protein [Pseudomonadota bacterium]
MSAERQDFKQWAIVELFGHARIAGLLTEQTIGGSSFVRVDVPEYVSEGQTFPAVTRLLGQASIYGITFVDEATATIAAREIRYQPVSVWSLRRGLEGLPVDARQRLLDESEIPY